MTPNPVDSVFHRHANPCVDHVRPYIPGPTSSAIGTRYGFTSEQMAKLSSNEAPLGPSPNVREAIRQVAAGDDLHRYPSPTMPELRKAVAKLLGVTPEQVLPGAGSSDTWPLIVRAFSLSGEEILVTEPSMTSFAEVATLSERRATTLDLTFPFHVAAADVLRRVTPATRVIFLSSPNNTTSRLIDPATILEIARGATEAVVVVDEHYIEAADDYRSVSAVNVIPKAGNIIVTRSLSKMYGLAGIRVGYAVGPEPAITRLMKFKAKWNISVVADAAARAALADEGHLIQNIEMTREGRAFLLDGLRGLAGIQLVPDAQGGFLLFRVLSGSAGDILEQLYKGGVIVRDDLLDGYIRVSVGTPEQNRRFLTALQAAL